MTRLVLSGSGVVLCPLLAWLAFPAAAVEVDAHELARCAGLTAIDMRVACYDALAKSVLPRAGEGTSSGTAAASSATAPATSAAGAPTASAANASGACALGSTGSTANASAASALNAPTGSTANAPATSAIGAPAAAPFNPNDSAHFGLTQRQLKQAPEGPTSIKAVVSQLTEDRLNNVSLVLDNGQTWTFIEPDPRVRPGDTVTIKRAALGSYLMITPSRRSYRVERLN